MGNLFGLLMFPALALQGVPPLPPDVLASYQVVDIVQMALVALVMIVLGVPMIIGLSRRFLQRPQAPPPFPPDVSARLERIEQAVDTISVEVERIAEAQRFSAKLMAGRAKEPSDTGRLSP